MANIPVKVYLYLCFFVFPLCQFAQNSGRARIDSLLRITNTIMNDTQTLNNIYALSIEYAKFDPDSGLALSELLFEKATYLKYENYTAKAYAAKGLNFLTKSDFPNGKNYLQKSVDMFEQLGDEVSASKSYNNIGNLYFTKGDLNLALVTYSKAENTYKRLGLKGLAATTRGNIGLVYQSKANHTKALSYFLSALKIFLEVKDSSGIARMLLNSANIYDTQKKYGLALNQKYKAIEIYTSFGDIYTLARALQNLSYTYQVIGLEENKSIVPDSLTNKDYCLMQAEKFLRQSIVYNNTIKNLAGCIDSYASLYFLFKQKHEPALALEYFEKHIQLRDSVFGIESQRKFTEVELNRANDIKLKELEIKNIQLQSAKKERWYFSALILVFVLLSFFIYRLYRIQRKTNFQLGIEKKKSDDLLRNILPEEIAEELKQLGHSEARLYSNVTVLFTDFVNFTGLSEEMGPTDLVNEINVNFTAFDGIVDRHGLEKIKTIGDAYLAVCGLPIQNENHAQKVMDAALEIQNYMVTRNGKFKIRIGIHSGPVVAGIVGVKKYAYDIWGDTVNTAARMEQNSEPNKINMSGATFELLKNEFDCTYRGKISAKNKGDIDMYFVHRRLGDGGAD